MKPPIRKSLLLFLFLLCVEGLHAQTKIAMPATKVEFTELGKKRNKKKLKELKLKDKVRAKQAKEVSRYVKKNTDLSASELGKYKQVLSALDSSELSSFKEELMQLEELEEAKEVQSRIVQKREELNANKEEFENHRVKARESREKLKDWEKDSLNWRGVRDHMKVDSTHIPDRSALDSLARPLDKEGYLQKKEEYLSKMEVYEVTGHQVNDSTIKEAVKDTLSNTAYGVQLQKKRAEFNAKKGAIDQKLISRKQEAKSYRDTIVNMNAEKLSKNDQIKNKLKLLVEKRVQKQGLALYSGAAPTETVTTPVKQYIPKLEKFDHQKPEIPDKELAKALVESEKKKRLDDLKNSVIPDKKQDSLKQVHFYDKLTIGGYFEYIPAPERIDITPSLAYGFTRKLSFGAGYNLSLPLGKNKEGGRVDGFRTFVDYVFYRSIYLHAESEWLRQASSTEGEPIHRERNTYVGLGKQFHYKFLQSNVLVLYNFNAPSLLHSQPVSFRFGISYSLGK